MTQQAEKVSLREVIDRRTEAYRLESSRQSYMSMGMVDRSLMEYRSRFGLYHLPDPIRFIDQTIEEKGIARVLDIGCGTGHALADLKKNYGDKVEAVGVTASSFGNYGHVDHVLYGDAQRLQSIDGLRYDYFDLAFSVHAAEYMADPLALLKGTYASLREGGTAYLGTLLLEPELVRDLLSFWYKNGYHITAPWDSSWLIIKEKTHPRLNIPVRISGFNQGILWSEVDYEFLKQ